MSYITSLQKISIQTRPYCTTIQSTISKYHLEYLSEKQPPNSDLHTLLKLNKLALVNEEQ